jgi:hypothetical protein
VEGALKVFTVAVRIAIAWTLLSLLLTAFWVLLLEVGRRFGSRPGSKPPARQEQGAAEIRDIYADFRDDELARGEVLVRCEPDETAASDAIVLVRWRSGL